MSTDDRTEEWRDVVGCVGYQVSDAGRLRTRRRLNNGDSSEGRWRIVAGSVNQRGYLRVSVPYPAGVKTVFMHALVLQSFVGLRPEGMECCHGDGDPLNNRLDNLRWGTGRDNAADRRRHGHDPLGEDHHCARLTSEQVVAVRRLSGFPRSGRFLARQWGVPHSSLGRAKLMKTWRSVPDDGLRFRFSTAKFDVIASSDSRPLKDICAAAKVHRNHLSHLRHGRKKISWGTVCRLAAALSCQPESLCDLIQAG